MNRFSAGIAGMAMLGAMSGALPCSAAPGQPVMATAPGDVIAIRALPMHRHGHAMGHGHMHQHHLMRHHHHHAGRHHVQPMHRHHHR
ncbi:hypothetical protein [Methylobacterium trifolii]|uniref:hypothetical protein n=1 Tax=Methylobacterium trifolii TaxID=1003092 RepID=UPI001EDD5600|nr:hypothetical protein [Methylobacterium trifolii]